LRQRNGGGRLSRGHTEGYDEMFRAFYGQDPQIGPMLKYRGLKP
jgi:peptidyl-dipeptidase Dcp